MSTLRLEIIGPPRLTIDGDERPLPSPKRLLVLCYLVLQRRAVTRPRLVDLFWPDLDESRGRAALRSTLAAIRAEVGGEVLVTKADTVAAAGIDVIDTDLERLGRAIDGRGPDDPKLIPLIEPVAERGNCEFMVCSGADGSPELDDWLAATAHRVDDVTDRMYDMLTSALPGRGDTLSALEYARKWVACKPGSAAAVKRLMTLALAVSRDAEAARCFEEHRAHVETELEDEPAAELQDLYRRVIGGTGPLSAAAQGRRPTRTGALPAFLDRFVGRQSELSRSRALLSTSRLVTVWGPGGAGKTRFAIELGRMMTGEFPDGVWFVPLDRITDSDWVASTVADTLGLSVEHGVALSETVFAALTDREILLILDNCEHVIDAVANLVTELVSAPSSLRIIVTTREPLGIPGERVVAIAPLSAPDEHLLDSIDEEDLFDYPAVELFVDRAASLNQEFTLDESNAALVGRICSRLDGLPLAIEIAAGAMRTLPLRDLVDSLDERFERLSGTTRAGADHHRTVGAVIEWSVRLLDEREAVVFRRLGVFPETWTLDGAEAVCAGGPVPQDEVLGLLDRLVAKSLVTVSGEGTASYRYTLLVRVFAHERLEESGELDEIECRHFVWCLALAREQEQWRAPSADRPPTANDSRWILRCRAALPSIREAIKWSVTSGRSVDGVTLAASLGAFWWGDMREFEGLGHLEELLRRADAAPTEVAMEAVFNAAGMSSMTGDAAKAERFVRAGLAFPEPDSPDPSSPAGEYVLYVRACLRWQAANLGLDDWRQHAEAAVSTVRRAGSRVYLSFLLSRIGWLYHEHKDDARARELFGEALAMNDALNHELYRYYGQFLLDCGDRAGATEQLRSGLHVAYRTGYPAAWRAMQWGVLTALDDWSLYAAAIGYAAVLLSGLAGSGYLGLARLLAGRIAVTYHRLGEPARAVRYRSLFDRYSGAPVTIGLDQSPSLVESMGSAAWREMEESLGAKAVEEERRTGATIRVSDAVQTALADARRFSANDPESATWLEYLGTDPEAPPYDE